MGGVVHYEDNGLGGRPFATNPRLKRSGLASPGEYAEMTPVIFGGRLLLLASAQKGAEANRTGSFCLWLEDFATHEVLSTFAPGYSLASALVEGETLHVWAIPSDWSGAGHIDHLWSRDLRSWDQETALEALPGEELFNESVCRSGDRFVMAFEARDARYPPFTIYFAESRDLRRWERIGGAVFGTDRYTACPALRCVDGTFYMLYLEHLTPRWWFETYLTRSRDLLRWEQSPRNPVLSPEGAEEINTSDPDLIELPGPAVRLWYLTGTQQGHFTATWADFNGSLRELYSCYF